MGTVLFNGFGLEVKRFYGGISRGVCVQITIGDRYVTLTYMEYRALIFALALDAFARGVLGT